MRSQASVQGHPIHPAVIVYPFAFLTGAFGFNVAAMLSRNRELSRVANHLVPAGIVAGLVAAVPGLIDYLNVVPPHSSGKERATQHALLNVGALGLFATSWLMSRRRSRPRAVPVMLQALGSTAMSVAGYMGGTLVFRNQIGVDHRYANAGKWQEEQRNEPASQAALVVTAAPLQVDQMKLVRANDRRIVVARTDKGVAAFDDRCTHRGGPLSDGVLICGTVQCPWHGSQFDVTTGKVVCGPAKDDIATYPTA
jgi:nitrite reductase/ring-hydroxylating ferredoxin subunit/uncharacterized membrane protein